MQRRLPVYLVLDISGSMTGEAIESVRQGLKALLSDLRGDPTALENAFLSVITFANSATQVCPLTDLATFTEPTLTAGGSTSLGAALTMLEDCLSRDVRKSSATQKGDYKPLVFLMTDGGPTDTWEAAADRVKATRPANIIACAAGPGANRATLQKITEIVVELKTLQPDQLRSFFKWVSASVRATSQRIDAAANGAAANVGLPPLPSGINLVI